MRIALYENLPAGGAKRAAFEFARELSLHGHQVDLWTTTGADAAFLPMSQVTTRQFCYPWPRKHQLPNLVPGTFGYLAVIELAHRLARCVDIDRRIAAHIDKGNYDFVFVHHCRPVHSPYVLRFLRTPSVYYCQEPDRAFYDPPVEHWSWSAPATGVSAWKHRWYEPASKLNTLLLKRADFANSQRATLIVANSYFSAESIYRAYHRRAVVSYLGVDVDRFRPLSLPRQGFVLSVGRIEATKGYDFLIEALSLIRASNRPRLLIVGDSGMSDERVHVEQVARRLNVSIEIRQYVSDAELIACYNQALALVYAPILEPFGLAVIEAMACGTPVVATAEGGVRESVKDGVTGILTQRQPQAFAEALMTLLDNAPVRRQLGIAGREAARSFWTWPAAYARFMAAIRQELFAGE